MSPSSAGPAPLGQLLSDTFNYAKAHAQPLFIGALIFGVVMGVLSVSLGAQVQKNAGMMMNGMGFDLERMQELNERMEAGDEQALAELEAMTEKVKEGDVSAAMQGMMKSVVPSLGLFAILSMLISFLAYAYYAIVAVEGKDLNASIGRAQKVILPLAGVSIWSFLRSFAWIPVIGFIPAIILGPRFIAAPLIFLTEGKGVMQSVSDSYSRTKGYWGKIIGNLIVAGILMVVVSAVLSVIFGAILMSTSSVMMFVSQVISQLLMAVMVVFIIRLSQTVLQNPR